jgi:hypothetical protein
LLGDGGTEPIILGDELADEFVQSTLEDAVHAAILQAGADTARLALGRPLPAISAGDLVEIAHDRFVTRRKRARQSLAQDQ